MKIKIHLLILFAFLSSSLPAQEIHPCPEEKDDLLRSIYTVVMDSFCKDKTSAFFTEDSTRTRYTFQWGYERFMNALDNSWMYNPPPFPIDSSWISFFKVIEDKKALVKKIRIPEFESIAKVYVLNKDTIAAKLPYPEASRGMFPGMRWMNGKIELSDVILSDDGNKAIVECSRFCGANCGEGNFFLLERDPFNNWKVVHVVGIWIA